MSKTTSIEAAFAAAEAPAREPLHIRVCRFHRRFRLSLSKLARRSSRIEDLLYVFPGAAVALAAGDHSAGAREHAVRLIEKGLPLAEAARALGLPMWLKRLPPEAFRAAPSGLPRDEGFGRSIVNFLPASTEDSVLWLSRLTFAHAACDPTFALWLARQPLAAPSYAAGERDGVLPLLPLAAFGWFSRRQETAARRQMRAPWHEKMTLASAVYEAYVWLSGIVSASGREQDGEGEEDDGAWRRVGACGDFCFIPLHTPEELREEGERMCNCLAQYADRIARKQCLIYSVRLGGSPVADLEIRLARNGKPVIVQFRGPRNAPPPQDAVRTVGLWFAQLCRSKLPLWASAPDAWASADVSPQRWEGFWRPYLRANPQFEAQLHGPTPAALTRLHADIMTMRRWA